MDTEAKIVTEKQIINEIVKGLFKTGWDTAMHSYWYSREFTEVIKSLLIILGDNKHFCPKMKTMFHWLKVCPFKSIKCVIMVDDTHNGILSNHGIPFSRDNSDLGQNEYTGKVIVKNRDIKTFLVPVVQDNESYNYNLERWCKQGVLMMPLASTWRVGGQAHYELWKDFRVRIIETIEEMHKDIPWLLVGEKAQRYECTIESKHTIPIDLQPELSIPNWNEKINSLLEKPIDWQ